MFKRFRIPVVVMLVLGSVLCAVWAVPKLTPGQQKEKDKCDSQFNSCFSYCTNLTGNPPSAIQDLRRDCQNGCIDSLAECYGRIGLRAPPRALLPPNVPTAQPLQPTSSPASTPKSKLPPTGPLTQASPTATPKRLTRQPQGTFTQASPSASPKSSPTTILKKKKKDH
jgi:hypothetical protein